MPALTLTTDDIAHIKDRQTLRLIGTKADAALALAISAVRGDLNLVKLPLVAELLACLDQTEALRRAVAPVQKKRKPKSVPVVATKPD